MRAHGTIVQHKKQCPQPTAAARRFMIWVTAVLLATSCLECRTYADHVLKSSAQLQAKLPSLMIENHERESRSQISKSWPKCHLSTSLPAADDAAWRVPPVPRRMQLMTV